MSSPFSAGTAFVAPMKSASDRSIASIPRASSSGGDDDRAEDEPAPSAMTIVADARWFNTYVHAAVVVGILGFLDAGYSGDWSRIGAVSVETEAALRRAAVILAELHVVAAGAAGAVAAKRGLPVVSECVIPPPTNFTTAPLLRRSSHRLTTRLTRPAVMVR